MSEDQVDREASSDGGGRLWNAGVVALVLAIFVSLLSGTIADPDLWGHVLFGKLTMALGGVARVDPYSYASAGTWINHEWLAEVIFGAAFDVGRNTGLVALKVGLGLGLLAWIYRRLWRAGLDVLRGGGILLLGSLPLVVVLGSLRPHVFTFILFGSTLAILRAAEEKPGRIWWLVPVMALWVNLHGGFLAGLGVTGVWVTVASIGILAGSRSSGSTTISRLKRAAGPAIALAVASAATLVNPYGIELPAFLLETATVPRPDISEWRPLSLSGSLGLTYLILLGGAGLTLWRAARRPPVPRLAVLAVVALTPFLAVRHLPLFALAVLFLLDDALVDAWGGALGNRSSISAKGGWVPIVGGGMAVLLATAVLARTAGERPCVSVAFSDEVQYPVRAVALLEASGVEANVAIFFNWGEYALWHLGPETKVGMDGRRETVYPESTYRSYLDFIGGSGDWDAFLELGPADLALVPPDKAAYNLLDLHGDWTLVYTDRVAGIFGRRGGSVTAAVAGTPVPEVPVDGEGLCFPGSAASSPQ